MRTGRKDYTRQEAVPMERPETVFEWPARRRNATAEEMRAYISARIAEGWNSPDPARLSNTSTQNGSSKSAIRSQLTHRQTIFSCYSSMFCI